jgi:hypothetical protein
VWKNRSGATARIEAVGWSVPAVLSLPQSFPLVETTTCIFNVALSAWTSDRLLTNTDTSTAQGSDTCISESLCVCILRVSTRNHENSLFASSIQHHTHTHTHARTHARLSTLRSHHCWMPCKTNKDKHMITKSIDLRKRCRNIYDLPFYYN